MSLEQYLPAPNARVCPCSRIKPNSTVYLQQRRPSRQEHGLKARSCFVMLYTSFCQECMKGTAPATIWLAQPLALFLYPSRTSPAQNQQAKHMSCCVLSLHQASCCVHHLAQDSIEGDCKFVLRHLCRSWRHQASCQISCR